MNSLTIEQSQELSRLARQIDDDGDSISALRFSTPAQAWRLAATAFLCGINLNKVKNIVGIAEFQGWVATHCKHVDLAQSEYLMAMATLGFPVELIDIKILRMALTLIGIPSDSLSMLTNPRLLNREPCYVAK